MDSSEAIILFRFETYFTSLSFRLTDTVNKLVEENQSLKLHPPSGHHQYHSLPFNANSASPPGGGGEQHYASVGPPANAATASPVRRASPGPGGGKQAPPAPPLRSGQTVSMYERPVSRGSSGGGGAPGLQQQVCVLTYIFYRL